MFRPGERGHMKKVHEGVFLYFRAQELHTLTITHLIYLFNYQSPEITLITFLCPVPLHLPLL